MAYTTVPTVATGDVWTAANHNQYIRDNFSSLFVGTAAGDVDYYDSASTKAKIAKPSVDSILKNTSAGVPSWIPFAGAVNFSGRQGGNATDWMPAGTTNYSPTTVKMEAGIVSVVCNSDQTTHFQGSTAVTFPAAFTYKPLVFVSIAQVPLAGYIHWAYITATGVSTTAVTISGMVVDASATMIVSWLAIGE